MTRPSLFQAIRNNEDLRQSDHATTDEVPAYQSTYQNRLRLIGMHLDKHDLQRAKVIEVPGGFLVRATGSDNVTDELLEFPDDAFQRYYEEATAHRNGVQREPLRIKSELVPTSYADVLRAIGRTLDEWMARSLLISEGSECIYVSGLRLQNSTYQSRYAAFDEILSPDQIDEILTAAYARRSSVHG